MGLNMELQGKAWTFSSRRPLIVVFFKHNEWRGMGITYARDSCGAHAQGAPLAATGFKSLL